MLGGFRNKNKASIKSVMMLMKPEWKMYVKGIAITGASSGVALLIPQAFKSIGELQEKKINAVPKEASLDEQEAIRKHNSEIRQEYIQFTLKWGALCTLSGVLGFYRRYVNTNLSNRVAVRLRNTLYQNFLSKPSAYFQNNNVNSSDLVHKLANDVSLVSYGLTSELVFGIRGLFFVIGGSVYLMAYAQPLIPPAILLMVVIGSSSKIIGNYQQHYKVLETEALSRTSQLAQERLQAIKLIKVSDTEQREKDRYRAELSQFYENARKYAIFQSLNFGILEGLGFMSLIGLLTYGSFLITNDMASPGMVSSSVYALYVAIGFRSLINMYTELIKTAGIYEGMRKFATDIPADPIYNDKNFFSRYQQYIEQENAIKDSMANPPLKPDEDDLIVTIDQESRPPPSIEFQNICFDHDGRRPILQGFNLKVGSGEIVALKGHRYQVPFICSGSGKTTLLNLLIKLISPQQGDILIDGESISLKSSSWIQQSVSYVPQEAIIFSASVYENICYGNQGFDQSLERVKWAAKMANADEFIESMPEVPSNTICQGYFTHLKSDGGVSLSGGQKQRLILARAILKDPRILILDEATSNLDPDSEQLVIQALKNICRNRTSIIVTHKIDGYKELITRIVELKVNQ